MTGPIGATFVERALAPLNEASGLLAHNRVAEALVLLSPIRVEAALHDAVVEAAKVADVGRRALEKLLPWQELKARLGRLESAQGEAIHAWQQHAGGLGGLLSGVGEVTVENEAPDVGWYLDRLAGKLVRDKRLSQPLDVLAAEITGWQQFVAGLASTVDTSPALRRSYHFKWARVAALGVALAVGIVVLGVGELAKRRARGRVDAALAAADPCAAEAVAPDDLARAVAEQITRHRDRIEACGAQRARAAHDASCAALAGAVDAGRLAPDDAAFAGDKATLLSRIATRSVAAADLSAPSDALECGCPAETPRLWSAFGRAAVASPIPWLETETVSAPVRHAVATAGGLPASIADALDARIEPAAKSAVYRGDAASIAKATKLCALVDQLERPRGKWCTALAAALAKQRPSP